MREADKPFDDAVTPTLPLPVPEVGDTVTNLLSLDAVQVQLGPLVVIAIMPAPPVDA